MKTKAHAEIENLIAKWRDVADSSDVCLRSGGDPTIYRTRMKLLTKCADDLESVLAALSPEGRPQTEKEKQ